jgi:hypothetical protein
MKRKISLTRSKGKLSNAVVTVLFSWNRAIAFCILKWKLLYGITLGQRQTDSNNQLIIISKLALTNIRYERAFGTCQS